MIMKATSFESVCDFGGLTGREEGGDAFRFASPASWDSEVGGDISKVFVYKGTPFDQLWQSKMSLADSILGKTYRVWN